ncbi:T9SS type A sorting domain-containing protein [Pantanalinema rosaneae CENA516]|uniref:T9SS type A sorting domain-containing protein n=1 Tax=Pantanalinema rosaneae TaxID=1620701 RepID=UPI003D6ED381
MNTNNAIDPGELLEMGEGFYTYNDSLGSNSVREVAITDINTSQPGVLLDSNGVYLISVAYTGTQTGVFTCVDPQLDYTASVNPYQQFISPVFVATWNPNGFGPTRVPSISAVTSIVTNTSSVENRERNDMSIRVYPNPARSDVYVRLSAESMIGMVNYEVMDITGRVVMSGEKMIDGMSDQINLSVATLQQGVYTLVTKTGKGFNSSRFVVTK